MLKFFLVSTWTHSVTLQNRTAATINLHKRFQFPGGTMESNEFHLHRPTFSPNVCGSEMGPSPGRGSRCPLTRFRAVTAMPNAQYTPPTPTRRNCFVASASAVCIGLNGCFKKRLSSYQLRFDQTLPARLLLLRSRTEWILRSHYWTCSVDSVELVVPQLPHGGFPVPCTHWPELGQYRNYRDISAIPVLSVSCGIGVLVPVFRYIVSYRW